MRDQGNFGRGWQQNRQKRFVLELQYDRSKQGSAKIPAEGHAEGAPMSQPLSDEEALLVLGPYIF